jgi:hypothetical protein
MKKNCKCQGQGEPFYSFFFVCPFFRIHMFECPISIHLSTNTNNKVNKMTLCLSSAFRSSLIISFNTIFFVFILSNLNKFPFLYITIKKGTNHTYHYIYVYILLISFIQMFIINKRYISRNWYKSQCSTHTISLDTMYHLTYDVTRKEKSNSTPRNIYR